MGGEVETDNDLVIRAQNGCRSSFENLIARHQRKMFGVCMRITRCPYDAEDSLREAELLLFLKIRQFKFDSKYTSWCFRVTANCAIQHLRKNKKHRIINEKLLSHINQTYRPICDLRWEQQQALKKAITLLSKPDLECFKAKFRDGLGERNIAQRLGLKEAGVKSRIFRLREKLKYNLREWEIV